MAAQNPGPGVSAPERRDRLLRELDHDPYHAKVKPRSPAHCPECGAVFVRGRWAWGQAESSSAEIRCPACLRLRDRVPAAYLNLSGDFFAGNRDEILRLVTHVAEREQAEHPLKRIMGSEEQVSGLQMTFTDAHLARGVGKALHDAYQGELDYQYSKGDILLRVSWYR